MDTRRPTVTGAHAIEMSERPRMRSISVAAFPSNGGVRSAQRKYSDVMGPGRKQSMGGRRVSLPGNLRKLPMRKKSTSKFKSIFEEQAVDPWDEIFMVYVSI
jgi:hypothetical protein